LRRDLVRLNNQLEALLEEAHIKLSSLISDLLGVSARRMLKALADGETNPAALAALAHERLRATPEQLCDALCACTELKPVYRRLLKMTLEHLQILEQQIGQLDQELATLLHASAEYQDGAIAPTVAPQPKKRRQSYMTGRKNRGNLPPPRLVDDAQQRTACRS